MSELRVPEIHPAGGSYTMSLKEQEEIWQQYVDEAYDTLIDFIIEREDEMRAGALERLRSHEPDYKDAAFKTSERENVTGGMEEGEDLLNYIIFALYAKACGR